ncbi:MAG: FMN-binding negative transcriptional regulator [Pseudomonadota bacterium]
MHPNPVYRTDDWARGLAYIQKRGFGVMTVVGPDGVLASHVPFAADSTLVHLHLVRSNPIARLLRKNGPTEALLIVSGPDSYISPDWYGIDDQVPTWNYVAVHLRGQLELVPEERMRSHLDRLSAENEARLLPKKPWTLDKNEPETLEKMMRMIVPAEFTMTQLDATWKLNQNKPAEAIASAADGVEAAGLGQNSAEMADLMRSWSDQ